MSACLKHDLFSLKSDLRSFIRGDVGPENPGMTSAYVVLEVFNGSAELSMLDGAGPTG